MVFLLWFRCFFLAMWTKSSRASGERFYWYIWVLLSQLDSLKKN